MDALTGDGLPSGWCVARLGDLGQWGSGGTPKTSIAAYFGGDIPWAKSGDLNDGLLNSTEETITADGLENSAAKIIEPGTLLIAMYGATIGVVSVSGIRCATNQAVAHLIPNPDVADVWFLFWLIQAARQELRDLGQGGAQPNLSQAILKSYAVALPPLAEQRRIVTRIGVLLDEVEAGEAALARARESLTQFRASLLHAACTGALTADWRATNSPAETGADLLRRTLSSSRSQDVAPLWEAPATWAWTNVGSAGQVDLGRQRAPQHHEGPHMRPYLRVANVMEDRLDLRDVKWMNFNPDEFAHYSLRPGDILLNEGQSPDLIGRPAIYNGEIDGCCFQKTLLRFRAGPCCTTDFAQIVFLHYLHAGEFRKLAPITTNMAHLTRVRFVEMPFPVPPLEEQEAIVFAVRNAFDAMSADSLAAVGDPVSALRQSILHAAFTGRLVPQQPADEPATALLTNLRATPAASRRPRARRAATQPDLIETPA